MNTKIVMIVSSIVLAAAGVVLEFLPHEALRLLGASADGINPLIMQMAGAMYLGYAMMNWMAKAVLIGGIYSRPLALGNFVHFVIGALALAKFAFGGSPGATVWAIVIVYSLFAGFFGWIVFSDPAGKSSRAA